MLGNTKGNISLDNFIEEEKKRDPELNKDFDTGYKKFKQKEFVNER